MDCPLVAFRTLQTVQFWSAFFPAGHCGSRSPGDREANRNASMQLTCGGRKSISEMGRKGQFTDKFEVGLESMRQVRKEGRAIFEPSELPEQEYGPRRD
jgi:hypothetical protein